MGTVEMMLRRLILISSSQRLLTSCRVNLMCTPPDLQRGNLAIVEHCSIWIVHAFNSKTNGNPQMILRCAVNKQAQQTGQELLDQVANAERERAATPDEVPLGQWEAVRVRPDYDAALTSQALLASSEEAKDILQACPSPHDLCLDWI